jgi:hypothetical protein
MYHYDLIIAQAFFVDRNNPHIYVANHNYTLPLYLYMMFLLLIS